MRKSNRNLVQDLYWLTLVCKHSLDENSLNMILGFQPKDIQDTMIILLDFDTIDFIFWNRPWLRFYLMKFTYDKIYIFIEMVAFDIPITVDNLGLMLLNIVILSFLDETVCKKKKKKSPRIVSLEFKLDSNIVQKWRKIWKEYLDFLL